MPLIVIYRCANRSSTFRIHDECKTGGLFFVNKNSSIKCFYRKTVSCHSGCLGMDFRSLLQADLIYVSKYACRCIDHFFCHNQSKPALHGAVRYFNIVTKSVAYIESYMFYCFFQGLQIYANSLICLSTLFCDSGKQRALGTTVNKGLSCQDIARSYDESGASRPLIKRAVLKFISDPDKKDVIVRHRGHLIIQRFLDRCLRVCVFIVPCLRILNRLFGRSRLCHACCCSFISGFTLVFFFLCFFSRFRLGLFFRPRLINTFIYFYCFCCIDIYVSRSS